MHRIRYALKHPRYIFTAAYWGSAAVYALAAQQSTFPFSLTFISETLHVSQTVLLLFWVICGIVALLPILPPLWYTMLVLPLAGHGLITLSAVVVGVLPATSMVGGFVYIMLSWTLVAITLHQYANDQIIRRVMRNGFNDANNRQSHPKPPTGTTPE